jgi:Glycosyl transferase family 1
LKKIAFFITPHGFGHAGRAAAVMEALHRQDTGIRFEIFTETPEWFFRDSMPGPFGYHTCMTDIGMVQEDPLREDVRATVRRLDEFLPFDPTNLAALAEQVRNTKCELVICDIAPLGIAVARAAAIPSVLIENFTWDWIYEGYAREDSEMKPHAAYLSTVFQSADYHVQTEPVSVYRTSNLLTPPVSRPARTPRSETRTRLQVPSSAQAVLITMGGMRSRHTFLSRLKEQKGIFFVIPGSSGSVLAEDNLVMLPHHSRFFHPDLIAACDAVIGKVGYSTVAEVYDAGVPFGYIPRSRFRESETLTTFAHQRMNGIEISEGRFESGAWLSDLPELLALPRTQRGEANGAAEVANFICEISSRPDEGLAIRPCWASRDRGG